MTSNDDKNTDSAHPCVPHKTSEFIGIVHISVAWILQRQFPLTMDVLFFANIRIMLGVLSLVAGGLVLKATHVELSKYSQPHKPGIPTTRLVTTGLFAYSRHPTYAAVVGLFPFAFSLLSNNAWGIITTPLSVLLFQYVLIKPEEAYLLARFPQEYKRYSLKTPRWI